MHGPDYDGALETLKETSAPSSWEEAVAACLKVLCLSHAGQPTDSDVALMAERYFRLEPAPEHVVFNVRLGLCVIDLAADTPDAGTDQVADRIIGEALTAGDAYAAEDLLSHRTCRAHMTEDDRLSLTELVNASGLRRGTLPDEVLADLLQSVQVSEASITAALARPPNHGRHQGGVPRRRPPFAATGTNQPNPLLGPRPTDSG